MKKIVIGLVALLLPFWAQAQVSSAVAGRASVGVDYKLTKGLHLTAEEEIRAGEDFSALGSLRTTVGVSYKPLKFLKFGVGYTFISPYKVNKKLDDETTYTGFWKPKHRLMADVTGILRLGDFQLSLKERLQLTHNSDPSLNVYQEAPNLLALKSRLAVKYKGLKWLEPSFSLEARTQLNGAWGSYKTVIEDGETYMAYTPAGYTHAYNDRYRANLSLDFLLGKHHTLTPYVLFDFYHEYEIDTNKKGTKLKSFGYQDSFLTSLGLSYVFSF